MASTLTEIPNGSQSVDQKDIDRTNLLLLTRMVIRGLLEHSMKANNRWITAELPQLSHLFIMAEKVLRHGFRANRTLITLKTPEQELWQMVEKLGRTNPACNEAVICVQQLPNVHSPICRVRAWLRLAFMQKKMADYFQLLIESKHILREYFEEFALLRHESTGVVLAGSLIGLTVIDCNLYMKEDDLSRQPLSVDLNLYIKIPTIPLESEKNSEESPSENDHNGSTSDLDRNAGLDFKAILDQKNYLEECNRQLSANNRNLLRRVTLLEEMRRHRSGTNTSMGSGADEAFEVLEVEAEGGSRTGELRTAMDLMERSVHEKQDAIVDLQQQIDDVKRVNLDLYQKLRSREDSAKQKDKLIGNLEKQYEKDKQHWQKQEVTFSTRLADLEATTKKASQGAENLRFELQQKTEFCAQIQTGLADARNEAAALHISLATEKDTSEMLEKRLQTLQGFEQEHGEMKDSYYAMAERLREYETALEELGVHLSESKLKVEDLKEGMRPIEEAQWESDRDVIACKQCEQKFSVARRKHHCRNCGGVFCNACSENTMPLPSSSKPLRVCDPCYQMLLQRFSSKPDIPDQ